MGVNKNFKSFVSKPLGQVVGKLPVALLYDGMSAMHQELVKSAMKIKEEEMSAVTPHEPAPFVKKHMTKIKDLDAGKEVYIFDNIGFLSGSAGILLLQNGKIVRQKTCFMS